ncbi:galactokinase [Nocardioides coralli]|uniref:galactokinase n=1 Tax=Nocardioides coralli TaxID=2872154 RepID=UPI001CA4690C|nr:galactokinase [Nocardioides coralli]QZY29202.1 galactokinase [Nocardioides coralli]
MVDDRHTPRTPQGQHVFAAPGRVNLIGEHTDYNGGTCLPIALPHVTTAAATGRDDGRLTATSRQQDGRLEIDLDDIAPGRVTGWSAYVAGVAWALRQEGHALRGADLVIDSQVPVGAGLSSSAALVCSSALALCAVSGIEVAPADLVAPTMRAESEVVGAPTGGMDQTVSLLARPGHALLIDVADHTTRHVPWDPGADGLRLLVIDTRAAHELSDGAYGERRAACEEAAERLGVDVLRLATRDDVEGLTDEVLRRRARHVVTEIDRVVETVAALADRDWFRVGALLAASHASLRDDFEVSCPELDVAVDAAVTAGALGARMTGGGFGGSAIALVREAEADEVGDRVRAAFDAKGWPTPHVLDAPASAGARRLS